MSFGEVLIEVQEVVASRVIAGHSDGHLRGPFWTLARDVFSECFFPEVIRDGGVREDVLLVRLIRGKFQGPITLRSIVETFAMLEGNGRRPQGK